MILFQIKILDKLKMPKESHRQDLATLKASACAVRDDIAFFESENDEHFTSEPASKKSLEHYEKNKNKLKELEKKIMLLSPKFLLQVNISEEKPTVIFNILDLGRFRPRSIFLLLLVL